MNFKLYLVLTNQQEGNEEWHAEEQCDTNERQHTLDEMLYKVKKLGCHFDHLKVKCNGGDLNKESQS